jgi:hypothetical protein
MYGGFRFLVCELNSYSANQGTAELWFQKWIGIERAEEAAQHLNVIIRHKKTARIQSMFKGCGCPSEQIFSNSFVVTNRECIVFGTRFESADGASTLSMLPLCCKKWSGGISVA